MKRISIIIVISFVALFLLLYFSKPSFSHKFVVGGCETVEQKPSRSKCRIYIFYGIFLTFIPLTSDDIEAFNPTWSPNGKSLAYIYQKGDKTGIGIIDEYNQTRYFNLSPSISKIARDLAWSPDGNSILFLDVSKNKGGFYLLNINNNLITSLIDINIPEKDSGDLDFTWSSLGTIAIELDRKIFTTDKNSQALQFLTDGVAPIWEPNGEWLTYYCEPNQQDTAICEITPDGKEKRILTDDDHLFFLEQEMVWTPDRRYIVFFGGGGGEGDRRYISSFDTQTKEFRNLYGINGLINGKYGIASLASPLK